MALFLLRFPPSRSPSACRFRCSRGICAPPPCARPVPGLQGPTAVHVRAVPAPARDAAARTLKKRRIETEEKEEG
eukprot:8398786-Pyramimonas_sp.AAC.1